ncbi:LysR family transcriptional regulator [Cystobacter fuscus]
MDRFDAMRVFTRIVELGSFTKAATDLGLPRATVTLAVQQLESRLGARLLHRTTREVSATPEGQLYYRRCTRVLSEVEDAEAELAQGAGKLRGKVRVHMVTGMAAHVVIPALPDFHERYPRIDVEVGTGDRAVDLARESVDCALRAGVVDTPHRSYGGWRRCRKPPSRARSTSHARASPARSRPWNGTGPSTTWRPPPASPIRWTSSCAAS